MKLIRLSPVLGPSASRLLADAFENSTHSWGRALGRPPGALLNYMTEQYMPEVLADAIPSLAAIDEECAVEDHLVGTLILEDFHKSDKPAENVDERSQAIPAIMRECHTVFWQQLLARRGQTKEKCGPICYFAFLAVHDAARRRRIGNAMVEEGLQIANQMSFKFAVAFCTSPKSTSLFSKQGFERWGEIIYKEFRLPSDGSIPFHSLPDSLTVMVKDLDKLPTM